MIEAYHIAAKLDITGNAQKMMASFARSMTTASKNIEKLIASVKLLNEQLNRLSPSLERATVHFKSLAESMKPVNTGFTSFNSRLQTSSTRADRLTSKLYHLNQNLKNVQASAAAAGGAIGAIPGAAAVGGGGAGGAKKSRFYGLHHAAALGLGSIAGPAAGIGAAYYMGGPVAAGAFGAGALMHEGFKATLAYQKPIGQLEAQGLSSSQMAQVNAMSNQVRVGISPQSFAESFLAAQMGARNFEHAKYLAPILAQGRLSANTIFGGMSENQEQMLIRMAEIRGGSDPKKIGEWLNVGLKMMSTSGGTIKPNQQAQFFKQATGAASMLTPLGYLSMEPVMQEIGGSKAGTAFQSGLRAFANPQVANFARYKVQGLKDLGLWDEKTGMMKKEFLETYKTDPLMFLTKVWLPALAKKGITSEADIINTTTSLMPRTTGGMFNIMNKGLEKSLSARALAGQALSGNELEALSKTKPEFANIRIHAAWETFSKAIGDFTSPGVIGGLNSISYLLEKISAVLMPFNRGIAKGTAFAEGNPDLASAVMNPYSSMFTKAMDWLVPTKPQMPASPLEDQKFSESLSTSAPMAEANVTLNVSLGETRFVKEFTRILFNHHDAIVEHGQNGSNPLVMATSTSMPSGPGGSYSQ